jgi:methylmalonyl-CoA mutase
MEHLTGELVNKARDLINEVLDLGGMAKAIEQGMPQRRIEEASARKQAGIDKGDVAIVGVNKYRVEKEEEVEILDIDNTEVRRKQIERLNRIRAQRNDDKVNEALAALTKTAESGEGNLLEKAVTAARLRATVGEISDALEKVWGRHRGHAETIKGVYSKVYEGDTHYEEIRSNVEAFAKEEGRRPRLLVAKLGQDGHDRGAKVVATAFADLGFDVDIGPLFSTPEEAAKQAIENDVHVIGVSSQAAGHKTLIPQLREALDKEGAQEIVIIAGGVIPHQDYEFLYQHGVTAVFGPGTNLPEAAEKVLEELRKKRSESSMV